MFASVGRIIIDTQSDDYAKRLASVQRAGWKRFVPDPYRWWLRSQNPGFVLDVGCGLGRGLRFLDGYGVGIDHNPAFVAACRDEGFTAFTPEEFADSEFARGEKFESLLMMHVVEHLEPGQADELLDEYLPRVRSGGTVICVTPQERGFDSDPSHTEFVDDRDLEALLTRHGLVIEVSRSFPLPRPFGKVFIYNEFTVTARKP